jgi:hypothetical protein
MDDLVVLTGVPFVPSARVSVKRFFRVDVLTGDRETRPDMVDKRYSQSKGANPCPHSNHTSSIPFRKSSRRFCPKES